MELLTSTASFVTSFPWPFPLTRYAGPIAQEFAQNVGPT
jgi:hypothetical protein